MSQSLIDGEKVILSGKEFIIPPLNLSRIKKLQDELAILAAVPEDAARFEPQQLEATISIIHMALTRNYPDLTREEVEDVIDMGNMARAMLAVMGQSGFKQGEPGPVTAAPPTGTPSIPSSSPSPAGLGNTSTSI